MRSALCVNLCRRENYYEQQQESESEQPAEQSEPEQESEQPEPEQAE